MQTHYNEPTAKGFFHGSAKGNPHFGGAPIREWYLSSPIFDYIRPLKKQSTNFEKQQIAKFELIQLLSKLFKPVQQVTVMAKRAHGSCLK